MIETGPMRTGAPARPRWTERHVLALGLALTGAFLAVGAVVALGTVLAGDAPWATIHLIMAGAATVAIGTFMPHFAVTLAGTQPRPVSERLAALGLLAAGAAAVVTGVTTFGGWLATCGAAAMLGGIGLVAAQTFGPMRAPLARRHHVVSVAYGAALAMLAVAITLGALGALGVPAVVAGWPQLRPAHAWLALFGAVSLTIFATLVYLAPTVLGARIRATPALAAGASGMLAGPPLAAVGFALDARPMVIVGMAIAFAGSLGQVGYVADVVRRRGTFSTEHDWRRASWGHLAAGAGWYAAALAAALAGVILGGPVRGWSIGALAIPVLAGWALQELIGSWTHLLPSVTPGGSVDHAHQRRALAVSSMTRLITLNLGVGVAWAGGALDVSAARAAGALLLGVASAATLCALGRALALGRYGPARTVRSSMAR